ncbi:MAG: aminopeptidase, partial [Christensenellaceae bacterium]
MKLNYQFRNGWDIVRELNIMDEVFTYSEEYKTFLDNGKTERTCAKQIIKMAQNNGYITLEEAISNKSIKPGQK